MLDRKVVKDFLKDQFKEAEIEIPQDVNESILVEAFSRYVERDYYEWLKTNFRAFFFPMPEDNPNWEYIKREMRKEMFKNEEKKSR